MGLEKKVRALLPSRHLETKSGEERLREPAEVKPIKGAKPGDKVVRLIRRLASKNKKRRKGWSWHFLG